jgi:hypothetical protein
MSGGAPVDQQTTAASAPSETFPWLKVWEWVAGATVLTGSVIYVLLQALYVEFYDDFGVRPEQVGLDRGAVLSRAAWAALLVLVLLAGVAAVVSAVDWGRTRRRLQPAGSVVIGLVAVGVVVVYLVARGQVEDAAEQATRGRSVDGINAFGTLVDIRAYPAQVRWLGDAATRPAVTTRADVMFLGRGDDVAVFYTQACSTIVVPAATVEIELLDQGANPAVDDVQLDWDPESC